MTSSPGGAFSICQFLLNSKYGHQHFGTKNGKNSSQNLLISLILDFLDCFIVSGVRILTGEIGSFDIQVRFHFVTQSRRRDHTNECIISNARTYVHVLCTIRYSPFCILMQKGKKKKIHQEFPVKMCFLWSNNAAVLSCMSGRIFQSTKARVAWPG